MVLQDELRNLIAEQQGMRMYVLSLVTAIFLPLSFLTGVLGMNVAGLPGTQEPKAFFYLATAMLIPIPPQDARFRTTGVLQFKARQ